MPLDKAPLLASLNEGAAPPLQHSLDPADLVGRIQAAGLLKDALHVVFDCVEGLFKEKETGNAVSAALAAQLQKTLSALSAGGRSVSSGLGEERSEGAFDQLTLRPGAPILRRPEPDEAGGYSEVPDGSSSSQRRLAASIPRPAVEPVIPQPDKFVHATGTPPAPGVALAGGELIKVLGRDVVPVYTEGAELLGAMPTFGENITSIRTELGQEINVGYIAMRVVVVPYNRGVDPHTIAGFVPIQGLTRGPIVTGPAGSRLILPDVQRPV